MRPRWLLLRPRSVSSVRGRSEVAKQRNGPTGKLAMTFLSEYQQFQEAAGGVEEKQ